MNLIKILPLNKTRLEILLEIYAERKDYLRSLSNKLDINPSLLYRLLKKFHNAGIIEKNKSGKEIFYSLTKNKDYKLIKNILEEYKLEKVIEKSKTLKTAVNLILNNKELVESSRAIYLFGSYAASSFNENSDIDFLFVNKNRKIVIRVCREISSIMGKTINPLIYSKEKFKQDLSKKEPLLSSIVRIIKNRAVIKQ